MTDKSNPDVQNNPKKKWDTIGASHARPAWCQVWHGGQRELALLLECTGGKQQSNQV